MIYPLTICFDRYNGVYSGGVYTAWNCDAENVPTEISDDDVTCANFWRDVRNRHYTYLPKFGIGSTAEAAIEDLRKKLMAVEEDFSVDESFKEYEKATRNDIFSEENLDTVPVARVREALGISEDEDVFEWIKYLKTSDERTRRLRLESAGLRHRRYELARRLADIREAAGMEDSDTSDLVEYVKKLREEYEHVKKMMDKYKQRYEDLKEGVVCALDYAELANKED